MTVDIVKNVSNFYQNIVVLGDLFAVTVIALIFYQKSLLSKLRPKLFKPILQ